MMPPEHERPAAPATPETPPPFRALVLEDDPLTAETLKRAVTLAGGEPIHHATLSSAIAAAAEAPFDLCLLDYQLPDGNGATFFHHLRSQGQRVPCIMLTGAPELSVAVGLTRHGLFDYLEKPADLHRLMDALRRAVRHAAAARPDPGQLGLAGSSPATQRLRHLLGQAAAHTDTTILLTGETGVGKDLVARILHRMAHPGTSTPFVAVNCATLPAEMFEAELFGAQKGAYTGAHAARAGLAAAAEGGTLFLDEIAEVPLPLQAKLLQLLEAREYRPLGSTATQPFRGRIMAATHRHLAHEVQAGRFRADLWFRLDVLTIEIPPLRHRPGDIPEIAEALLEKLCRKTNRPPPALRPEDAEALQSYPWPGNVRELRNVLERSLLLTGRETPWLQLDGAWARRATPRADASPPLAPPSATGNLSWPATGTGGFAAAMAPARMPPNDGIPLGGPAARPVARAGLAPLEQQEYEMVREALTAERGFIRRAAARLGISHQALLRRLDKWPELRTPSIPPTPLP